MRVWPGLNSLRTADSIYVSFLTRLLSSWVVPRTSSLIAATSYPQPNQGVIEIQDTNGVKRKAERRGGQAKEHRQ